MRYLTVGIALSSAADIAASLNVSHGIKTPGIPRFSSLTEPATPAKVQEPQSPIA
ncbi:hypothetical protein ACFLXY_03150 [Chloroflexota bacterium]